MRAIAYFQQTVYLQDRKASTKNRPEKPHCCDRTGFFGVEPGGQ